MSSFFKRPSWAVKDTSKTGTEFYRRSEQTYSDIVAATREAHQKPKAPTTPEDAEDTEETEDTEDTEDAEDKEDTEPKKRPRLSEENEHHHKDTSPVRDTINGNEREKLAPAVPPKLPSPSYDVSHGPVSQHKTIQRRASESRPSVIPQEIKSPEVLRPPPVRLSALQADKPATRSPRPVQSPTIPVNDPVVQIIISSEIPNTKPLLVHRKMSQSLREVRLAWCKRQDFESELHPSVHLTWKGRRLFDVTTCRSLGIKARENSSSILDIDDDSAEQKELRIHMEAVSDAPALLNRQAASPNNEQHPAESQPPPEDDQGEPMKLVLRSPGLDDFKIKARQKTQISRLISAFRNKQNIPADREIILEFDGDKLDPDESLGHYDIDDLDLVDVQIK
ncbi:hypothetical protein N7457_009546 [Penicillium paradoxum]|uniref:uncharacterized protein n=1 Tax=Penicillium paradoxum TaxID=176176 RepID=UPI0025489DCD|nr:uncharacterized protein N7457_009546 [Penicillium paradoxum]KAJ5774650.1 hypothetical protein N7457_009546 [Penicillium paradoxum]